MLVDSDGSLINEESSQLMESEGGSLGGSQYETVQSPEAEMQERVMEMSSGSSTPVALDTPTTSNVRGKQIIRKKKVTSTLPSVNSLVETCASVGETLNKYIEQSAREAQKDISNDDYYYALSLAESLSQIKDPKKKLLLKSQFLVMIADALTD